MRMKMMGVAVVLLVLVPGLVACGGGDKGGIQRQMPIAVVTGQTGTNTGGTSGLTGGGGGGGAAGACVITGYGMCLENVSSATCQASGGSFTSGATCASLGFPTCTTTSGQTICN